MKNKILIGAFALFLTLGTAYGRDIPQSQVPSVVVNNFQQKFPKASDVEWEMDGEMFKVEFELGLLGQDHEVWYDKMGKLIRHKEEISSTELPQKVSDKIKSDYNGFRTSDVDKITEGGKVSYKVELKTLSEKWKVLFDADGNVLSKKAD